MWDAIYAFVRKQIGLPSDAASNTGSLHARMQYQLDTMPTLVAGAGCFASDTLQASSDTVRTESVQETYTKHKEFAVALSGTVRVAFDFYNAGDSGANARIYINGVAVGTERLGGGIYQTYTQDFSVTRGDRIQLYLRKSLGGVATCRNFRLYYTVQSTPVATYDA